MLWLAYDSLVEDKQGKENKFFMGSLALRFCIRGVCHCILGSWQSFFKMIKQSVFSGFSTLQICPPPWSCVVEFFFNGELQQNFDPAKFDLFK